MLKPGDTIRTGRNGRVLLVRGEETILISPNSVVGVAAEKKDGLSTTILQQAGSILLEVEKRNVKHFEVETPYLAAVVKGTQFSVTVECRQAPRVDVQRGQVEVSDFKSGQIAQVMPGQAATSFDQRQGRALAERIGHLQSDRAGQAARVLDRTHPGAEGRPSGAAQCRRRQGRSMRSAGTHRKLAQRRPSQRQARRRRKRNVIRISNALGEVQSECSQGHPWPGAWRGCDERGAERLARSRHHGHTVWSGDGKSSTSTASAAGQTAASGGNGGQRHVGGGSGGAAERRSGR